MITKIFGAIAFLATFSLTIPVNAQLPASIPTNIRNQLPQNLPESNFFDFQRHQQDFFREGEQFLEKEVELLVDVPPTDSKTLLVIRDLPSFNQNSVVFVYPRILQSPSRLGNSQLQQFLSPNQ